MKRILIVGGLGFIGSHLRFFLQRMKYDLLNIDRRYPIKLDIRDESRSISFIRGRKIDTLIYVADDISVAESILNPSKYYMNNVFSIQSTINLVKATGIRNLIYASSAAVYGQGEKNKLSETCSLRATHAYGLSKIIGEELLEKESKRGRVFNVVILRYFNIAGAMPEQGLGENHQKETHLIPLICRKLINQRRKFTLYGGNLDTYDGFAIRDYVHIADVCRANLAVMQAMDKGLSWGVYNIGTAQGYSSKEIFDLLVSITNKQIKPMIKSGNSSEVSELIANINKARKELNWAPQVDINETLLSAWLWEQKRYQPLIP